MTGLIERYLVSLGVGLLAGAAINYSLGYRIHDRGGLLGGLMVGFLMATL